MAKDQRRISRIGIGGLCIAGLIGAYLFIASRTAPTSSTPAKSIASAPTSPVAKSSSTPASTIVFAKATTLTTDLGLFAPPSDSSDGVTMEYFDIGKVMSGKYVGYRRILGISSEQCPCTPDARIFATQDNLNYVVNDGFSADGTFGAQSTTPSDPLSGLNTNKVHAHGNILDASLNNIPLDSQFSLQFVSFPEQSIITVSKDAQGNPVYVSSLTLDLSQYKELKSPITGYKAYYHPNVTDYTNIPADQQAEYRTEDALGLADSAVYLVDQGGLVYEYSIATKESVGKAQSEANKNAKAQQTTYIGPYLTSANMKVTSGISLYPTYDSVGQRCGNLTFTDVYANLDPKMLTQIGTYFSQPIYALNTSYNDFANQIANGIYELKIGSRITSESATEFENEVGGPPLTYDQYLAKKPVLFVKDYWGRWMALNEAVYNTPGGCGKPVVYLYPTKPTQVSVQFTGPIKLDVNIPTYSNGWKVLAQPNGQLTDLQPQATDCTKLSTDFGTEYAIGACKKATYPYIYWSGNAGSGQNVERSDGWVVTAANLKTALTSQLTAAGLSSQEQSDMLSYWVPTMLKKGATYYHFAFLQTAQMNAIAPMRITPTPDTTYRLFLTWGALPSMPTIPVIPEVVKPIVRNGFTLVEWGGLDR